MPKYFQYKVAGYYLYFTMHCVVECMHAHASDQRLSEAGSAKFFVKSNGDSYVQKKGTLTDHEIVIIRRFIKDHYREMYELWAIYSKNGFWND